MAKPTSTSATSLEQHLAEIANRRKSHLEMTYGQFHDKTIDAEGTAWRSAGRLMRDLNSIFSICTGMATVMRIVAGNETLRDFHDPDDSDSEPPLSMHAINSLTTMVATVCEWMADDISRTADDFNGRGEQA